MINRIIILAVLIITVTSSLSKIEAQAGLYSLSDIQPPFFDSLTIERANGQKIKMIWPYRKNIHKAVAWEQLLDDFQSDFLKVSNNVPNYDYYHINYIQKKNLVVNEVVGRQTYTVNEQDGIYNVKSNQCKLKGGKIGMSIEFTAKAELLDPSLKQDIKNAVAQVKNKFYISAVSPERHLFDAKNNKMLPRPKSKYQFFVPFGVQLGVLRNNPYIELRPGIGLIVDKRGYMALQYNIVSQYNDQLNKTEFDNYLGFSGGALGQGFGSEFGFLVKSGITKENNVTAIRAGINYRTKGGMIMGAQYYISNDDEKEFNEVFDFSFSIGYGF